VAAKLVEVAAGLVFRDQRLLITQRFAGAHLGGKWEFPGGKREAGETFEACLIRELQEELGIHAEVGALLETLTHAYPEKTVHLQFFKCRLLRNEPQAIGCPAFQWITREQLRDFPFPEADAQLIRLLEEKPEIWD
jgi:mutator protein MutT